MENIDAATPAITADAAVELILSHIAPHGRSTLVDTANCLSLIHI